LTLGICTRFAALGSVALMAMAVYSLQVVKGFGWTWNTGGYEYPVFWGICSLALAVHAWKAWLSERTDVVRADNPAVRMAPAE
jgi:putative oxidoreductase